MYIGEGSYEPLDVTCIKLANIILTQYSLNKLQELYREQQEDIAKRLKAIENGASFGYAATFDEGYYPSTFMEVLNRETGYIMFHETSVGAIHQDYVSKLVIEGLEEEISMLRMQNNVPIQSSDDDTVEMILLR